MYYKRTSTFLKSVLEELNTASSVAARRQAEREETRQVQEALALLDARVEAYHRFEESTTLRASSADIRVRMAMRERVGSASETLTALDTQLADMDEDVFEAALAELVVRDLSERLLSAPNSPEEFGEAVSALVALCVETGTVQPGDGELFSEEEREVLEDIVAEDLVEFLPALARAAAAVGRGAASAAVGAAKAAKSGYKKVTRGIRKTKVVAKRFVRGVKSGYKSQANKKPGTLSRVLKRVVDRFRKR